MPDSEITFLDNHIPALEDGHYTVTVSHNLNVKDNPSPLNPSEPPFFQAQPFDFHVEGPRFALDPALIHSVYPPEGGRGDYRTTMASVVLNRSTLPWERLPVYGNIKTIYPPWLFVFLVDESELASKLVVEQQNIPLTQLTDAFISSTAKKKGLVAEDLEKLPKKINYLEVDTSLAPLFPETLNQLQYLSYARIKDESGNIPGEEKAVVMANRLPTPGSDHTAYLVSLENNYNIVSPATNADENTAFSGNTIQVTDGTNTSTKFIVPYLYKWKFHALDEKLYCITSEKQDKIIRTLGLAKVTLADGALNSMLDILYHDTESFTSALAGLSPSITDQQILKVIETIAELPGSTFHGMLSNLKHGFAPLNNNPAAPSLESTGTVQLPYLPIQPDPSNNEGAYTTAWYRGPLATTSIYLSPIAQFPDLSRDIQVKKSIQLAAPSDCTNWASSNPAVATVTNGLVTGVAAGSCSITCTGSQNSYSFIVNVVVGLTSMPSHPGDLIIKDTTNQITDQSYAAAYELGRLTALDDVSFSQPFFKWKHETAMAIRLQVIKSLPNYKKIQHLPLTDTPEANPLPQQVQAKFDAWKNLYGIPYRYLVPDPQLLPEESIRFFTLDRHWINAFICGAFSIGHTVEADLTPYLKGQLVGSEDIRMGFLINSLVVSGWPDFLTDAFSANDEGLSLLRKSDLDKNIRLYLISGQFETLDFYLHPAKTHPGFVYMNKQYKKMGKTVYSTSAPNGNTPSAYPIKSVTVTAPAGNCQALIVDPAALSTIIGAQSIAQFAGMMLEGIPKVVFDIEKQS